MTEKDLGQGVRGTTPSTYASFKDQSTSYGAGQPSQPSSRPTDAPQGGASQAGPSQTHSSQANSPQGSSSQTSSAQAGSSQGNSSASSSGRVDIKQKVSEDIRAVQQTAQSGISDASEKAKEVAANQKNIVAEKVGGLAAAMDKIGGELEQGEQADIGRMTRNLGSTLQKFSDDIKDRDLGEIAGMAEDFGRKQPLAFMGLAAIAGLAASRFLTASAGRHQDSRTSAAPQATRSTGTASPSSFTSAGSAATEDKING